MIKSHFSKKILLIISLLLASTHIHAKIIQGQTISIYNNNPDDSFIISKTEGYEHYYTSLKKMIWLEKQKDKKNHFCMIGYKWSQGDEEAIIIWKEMKSLHRWRPKEAYPDPYSRVDSMYLSNKFYYIDELVNTPLSPYYVGSPRLLLNDAKRIIDNCNSTGEIITIEPIKISEKCLQDAVCPDAFEASVAEYDFSY